MRRGEQLRAVMELRSYEVMKSKSSDEVIKL